MSDLPESRKDGLCADCVMAKAKTRDGRFCVKCLRRRVAAECKTPFVSPREMKGRKTAQVDRYASEPKHDNHGENSEP